ncbi:MAG: acetyl-CoA carboxylase biotin carboxylase subunit [Candidatus Sericytochromatia bacterium]
MFKKVLIANRGEIANRVIKTCKKLGIKTVAIYSEADKEASHVKNADEAYCVGEAPVNKSYLNIDKIIEVAKESGSEAIHPGYGLLSENSNFSNKAKENKIVFIGPSNEAMEKMALKVESRELAKSLGLPLVLGSNAIQSIEELKQKANEIGYPVMLKASAGGGGIGMEVVFDEGALEKSYKLSQGRAKAYFGNPTMYIEKFIEEPRHIEVQVFADKFGNTVHIGERECSIQRRHQKVIEECPSIFLTAEKRNEMTSCAVKLAKAVNYENAGTVEFIVDNKTGAFYFLEMNTRLQVEHPVTEEVTGLDLVHEQLKVANEEKLSFTQEEINFSGHSIECRIYAEDPVTFMPSPGKITKAFFPEMENFRVDTCIFDDYTVTPFYDPLLAKIISKGATRDEAINTMLKALEEIKIEGIKTNIELHKKILNNENFKAGKTTTNFIKEMI